MKNTATTHRGFLKIRKLFPLVLVCMSHLMFSTVSFSQQSVAYTTARDNLIKVLKKREISNAYSQSVDQFYFKSCDSLLKTKTTVDGRPIEVILTRLFDASNAKLNSKSITLLRIPSVNHYFLQTLKNYKMQPIKTLYREVGIVQSTILESAFDGLPLGDSIATFVGLREMINAPYFISTRLSKPRFTPYRDTLVYYLANTSPRVLTKKIAENDALFTGIVSNSNNMTVKAVSQIQNDTYYDKTIPFSLAILQNKTTAESVKKLSLVPSDYYRAFVDEALRLYLSPDPQVKSFLEQPIVELNKTLSNQYYISEINMLHESPDKVRFEILNKLNTRELYFLLVGGSGELYTSSFLYLYKKFLKDVEKEGLDQFFKNIDYYQFAQFITNISGYGLVNDLVNHMQAEQFAALLGKYFTNGPNKQRTDFEIILNAMILSEILYEVRSNKLVRDILIDKLNEGEKLHNDIMVQRMFAGFKDILEDNMKYKTDATYDVLAVKRLQTPNGIVQAWFFYDDDDGASSFNNSMASFDAARWNKKDMGNYYVFNTISGNNMKVYLNKPNTKLGSDSAQDEMLRAIKAEGNEITSFVHRGHSYYLFQSLEKLPPSCQFVFLGSCGGYSEVVKVFLLNPDANIISTRNIGSKLINDPLLRQINLHVVNNQDVVWDVLWKQYKARFESSKLTKDLFSSYIPPNKYIGIKFIRNVFNF